MIKSDQVMLALMNAGNSAFSKEHPWISILIFAVVTVVLAVVVKWWADKD
jgi:hypothetical protein